MNVKDILGCIILAMAMALSSCGDSTGQKEFIIQGTTPQSRLNGVQVFLVPVDPSLATFSSKAFEDSLGVDSVVIMDGKFEFRGTGEYVARISIDKMNRYGTQDLLVVTEPGGVITVVIDSISTGHGTPQNEALQQWKDLKQTHDMLVGPKMQELFYLRNTGDSIRAEALADSIRVFNADFSQRVMDIANLLGSGTAFDLLSRRYAPKKVKDGELPAPIN